MGDDDNFTKWLVGAFAYYFTSKKGWSFQTFKHIEILTFCSTNICNYQQARDLSEMSLLFYSSVPFN